ncbi:type IV secretory system conjugative DNA transfer family protein [Streptomyces achromogenes]|uniref:type IV secretory system conjugative DNA transfer family protein n=1 Tax=Streptomyces achromogenes TaxID=67255 RepID=UPI00342B0F94
MNDNSKGSTTTTNTKPMNDTAHGTTDANTAQVSAPLARIDQQLRNRPARYTALAAVPATFLAAGETPDNGGPGFGQVLDVMGTILGTGADIVATGFSAQPLLASALTVALAGAGYLKVKEGSFLGGVVGETDGFAPPGKLRKHVSRRALMRKKTRRALRPSLADVPPRQIPTTELGVRLGRDRKTGIEIWSPIEDSTVTIAPMGAGKTGLIANFVVDAPGSVVATSTKVDIVKLTAPLRQRTGGRIWIFNPMLLGSGKYPSNLLWDPVIGCKDPKVALRRAKYLLDGADITAGLDNRDFWNSQSFKVLKSFLWAADMAGLTLLDVARWSKKPLETPATDIFEQYAGVAPAGWADDLKQTQAPAAADSRSKTTTLDNVFLTLSSTFECLSLPDIAQSVLAAHDPSVPQFDVEGFIASGRDTVYILGEDTGTGGIGPLFTTLTGDIYEAARRRAPAQEGERNDPPLTFDLDEAALICPVPLEKWTADSRGLGMTVHAAFQSRGQIRDRWGRNGAETIWDNCTALILGGLKNDDHLESMSKLTGTKRVKEETGSKGPGPNGTTTTSSSFRYVKEPTMSPSDIMYLEPGEVLIFRRHLGGPVVARYQMVWDRKDLKQVQRDSKKAARAELRARKRKDRIDINPPVWAPVPPVVSPAGSAPAWVPAPPAVPPTIPAPPAVPPAVPAASARPTPTPAPTPAPAEEPWAPPSPSTSPWTSAPAASGWAAEGVPAPREHLRIVPGEVVEPVQTAAPAETAAPSQPVPAPAPPASAPTVHLEQTPPQSETTDHTTGSETAQDTPPRRRARNFGAF